MFRRLRRTRLIRDKLLPEYEWRSLVEDHPILKGFSAEDLGRLRELATVFLHEKTFEAARGLHLTEFMKAVIALQASLPILNLGPDWYRNWKTVVVVPDVFVHEHLEYDAAGVAHEWKEDQSGEAWERGPVALSWRDVEQSGWGDGYNVVIHEAAHKLDLLDGELNGRPALHEGMSPAEWYEAFSRSFEDLQRRPRRGRGRLRIDDYAAENDSEFFAVASEYFFEQPRVLQGEYPEVYRQLGLFFRQDPAARQGGPLRSRRQPSSS